MHERQGAVRFVLAHDLRQMEALPLRVESALQRLRFVYLHLSCRRCGGQAGISQPSTPAVVHVNTQSTSMPVK